MNDENAYTARDGVTYFAETAKDGCTGCAFLDDDYTCNRTLCVPPERKDRRNIIWIKESS